MKNKDVVIKTMKALEDKFGRVPKCPFCNDESAKWIVRDSPVMSNAYDVEKNMENPSNAIVNIPMSCDNCGFRINIDPNVHGTMD